MRTVNGAEHATFKGACVALNLVRNENELEATMMELALCEFPSMFRRTFAMILYNIVNPINPLRLWKSFKMQLAEDYLYHHPEPETSPHAWHMLYMT